MKHKYEEEEHIRLMEENRLENEKIAKLREERLKIEAEKTRERVLASLIVKEAETKLFEAEIDSFLQQQKVPFLFLLFVYTISKCSFECSLCHSYNQKTLKRL